MRIDVGTEPRSPAATAVIEGPSHLIASALGGLVVVGVYLDGWAHLLNRPDSFFTPWHDVLYSAVLALLGWLVVMGSRHGRRRGGAFQMPAGYGTALAGAVLFLAGGAADLLWHTMFGIEVGLETLLSPAHLWLFAAGALLLSGPARSALAHRRTATGSGGLSLAAAVIAVTSLAGLAAFVMSFLSAYLSDAPARPVPPAGGHRGARRRRDPRIVGAGQFPGHVSCLDAAAVVADPAVAAAIWDGHRLRDGGRLVGGHAHGLSPAVRDGRKAHTHYLIPARWRLRLVRE